MYVPSIILLTTLIIALQTVEGGSAAHFFADPAPIRLEERGGRPDGGRDQEEIRREAHVHSKPNLLAFANVSQLDSTGISQKDERGPGGQSTDPAELAENRKTEPKAEQRAGEAVGAKASAPEASSESRAPKRFIAEAVLWLWNLSSELKPLARATIVCVAFLMAFLTVAALWKVPSSKRRWTQSASQAESDGTPQVNSDAAGQPGTETPFTNNLGRTVMSGLGGLVLVSFLEPFWEKAGIDAKTYYLVWFVVLFTALLVFFALAQGLVEALRSRITIEHRAPSWRPLPAGQPRKMQAVLYWGKRLKWWLLSFKISFLIFFDTVLSFVTGENRFRNFLLGDIEVHRSLVRAVDRVRDEITGGIRRALAAAGTTLDEGAVRVNITVLSSDGSSLFYISWARGSLVRPFDKRSVAWVSVYAGEPRWWRLGDEARDIVLFNNQDRRIPVPEERVMLRDYFQPRESHDYEAFVVMPVPWSRRGLADEYRKAGIHISFSTVASLDRLWNAFAGRPDAQYYEDANRILDQPMLSNAELGAVLHQSIEVLGELLRGFNQAIFENYIRPGLTA